MSAYFRRLIVAAVLVAVGVMIWTSAVSGSPPIRELPQPRWQGSVRPVEDLPTPTPTPSFATATPTPVGNTNNRWKLVQLSQSMWIVIVIAVILCLLAVFLRHTIKQLLRRRPSTLVSEVPRGIDREALERDVVTSLTAALQRLRASTQPSNDVVVQCWREMEEAGARHGVPRLVHQTSSDYVVSFLAETGADPDAVSDLGALYRKASFSQHETTDADREAAIAALQSALTRLGWTS